MSALASNTKSLTIAGTANHVATTATSFSNTGGLTINSGDNFTAAKLTQISGSTLSGGTFVLSGNLNLTTSGIKVTTNSTVLTLSGGTIDSNGINALSGLAANTKSLTIAGTANHVSTAAASFSNTGKLTINSGDSFTAPVLSQISGTTLSGGIFVLGGILDLTSAANITTNDAVLTLEGGSIKTGSTNDLANLGTNANSLTLVSRANFSTVGSFTNSGSLTVDSGSKFTVTTGTLTNLASGILTGGTYNIGGSLQLTSANGGITINAANLTLTGTSSKILDGTSNALAGFNNNTGTFALASDAALTTASGTFSNSGTLTVAKDTTLTVGGTSNSYNQTAGTTTVDGTLSGGTSGAVNVTGGTILGGGTLNANTSVGNASGTTATINIGDNGKAGLLAITGTYVQLATGTMTGFVTGTAVGTGFSQINVSGTAALAGTINFTVAAAFQSSLTVGETFTVLNASGVTGTFSNSTIAINSSVHFTVSYTSTGVVLTVASGPTVRNATSSPAQIKPTSPTAAVATKTTNSKRPVAVGAWRHAISGDGRPGTPIVVASWPQPSERHSNVDLREPVRIGTDSLTTSELRSWERTLATPASAGPLGVVTPERRLLQANSWRAIAPAPEHHMGESQLVPEQSLVRAWTRLFGNPRAPVKVMQPILPHIGR